MIQSLIQRSRFTPFTVGCVLPLTGNYALFGRRALNGIELALSQFTEQGDGVPLNLLVRDSRSDPATATLAVDQLDEDHVGVILGPMTASEAAAQRAQTKGIPIFVFTQREGVTDIGPYVFRNFITPPMLVHALVAFIVQELDAKRFAILYPDEKYGRQYMHLFWDQVVEHDGVVNAVEPYDPEGTDFAEPIKKMTGLFYEPPSDLTLADSIRLEPQLPLLMTDEDVSRRLAIIDPLERISGLPLEREAIDALERRSSNADDQWHPQVDFDAVFIPDAPKKTGLIIPQLAYYDIRDIYLLGTNLWNSQTLLTMAGEYMQDALIADGFFADSPTPRVGDFVNAFQRIYERRPGVIEAVAYDSAMMVFETMRRTATTSRRDLKAALLQIDAFDGVSGRTTVLTNGEADKELYVLRFDQGRFVQVQPIQNPEPPNTGSKVEIGN